jgi:hypothetical protein
MQSRERGVGAGVMLRQGHGGFSCMGGRALLKVHLRRLLHPA